MGKDLAYMIFAEQRLLSMVAEEQGIPIHVLSSNFKQLFTKQQEYTHVWGQKEPMRRNPKLEDEFCQKVLRRLQYDFPEWVQYWRECGWLHRHRT